MNDVTKFKTPSGDDMVVMPAAEYEALLRALENAVDLEAVGRFEKRLRAGDEEFVPAAVVNRILDGANPIRVWREYRGLSAAQLARSTGIAQAYLSQMENGKRDGTVGTLKKIAEVLRVTIDELVPA